MPDKSAAQPEIKIKYLSDEPVKAPTFKSTYFKLGGSGFVQDMVVYISTKQDGSDKVDVEVLPDDKVVSTDKVWPVVAKPAFGLKPTDPKKPLWVAIKLNNQVKDTYEGFLVV
ncbi:hypothetical protein FHT82_003662 [Rhizobium sp. BK275]|uniref:hypothetical protein n=1 Tax=Rhizobium sp. BK275 TaxID=2587077 RepID=UPI0016074950|nr:hypothetical protein [Rhizobium sp. BK275]MBB3390890.1 hypothetical protein [Rhizobium sp. BK275]